MSAPVYLSIEKTKDAIVSSFEQFKSYGGPGNYVPLILWGEKGIGKTSAVKQARALIQEKLSKEEGKEVTVALTILKLSAMQPFTVNGYPFIDKVTINKDGEEVVVNTQKHAMPEFLVRSYECDYHMVFVDEINRARPEMHNAIMGLLDGDGINEHPIPKNLFLTGAANPSSEDYTNVTDMDDVALLDRGIHINVSTARSETMNYMYNVDSRINKIVHQFLQEDKKRIQVKDKFQSITGTLGAIVEGDSTVSDRQFAQLGRFYNFIKDDRVLVEAAAKGLLGNQMGELFVQKIGTFEALYTPEQILDKMDKSMTKTLKDYSKSKGKSSRLDIISRLNETMITHLNVTKDNDRKELKKKQLNNLKKYLDSIPHDIRESFFQKTELFEGESQFFGKDIEETLSEDSVKVGDLEFR